MTNTTINVIDRNETKFLFAMGLIGTPSPRDPNTLDFEFDASEQLFEARRAYSLNAPVPVLTFITASKSVDKAIYEHRQLQGVK